MYRHFAIGTIAISVIVAVFASGETQDAMAQNHQRTEMTKANEEKFGKTKLTDKRDDSTKQRAANAGFSADPAPPADMGSSRVGDPGTSMAHVGPPRMTVIIEPNEALMAKMNATERKAYVKKLQDDARRLAAKGPYIPSPEQVAALTSSSAERSGPPTID